MDFPPYSAKVFTSEPICIASLPDSSTLLSGPGLSPPPPHRFRLVISHNRTQSLPDESSAPETNRHLSSLDTAPSPFATVERPLYLNDPETPGLYFTGRETDHTFIDPPACQSPKQTPREHAKQLHHRRHSDSTFRTPRNRRLRHLRRTEPCESIREEGEGTGRGGRDGGVDSASAVELELDKTIDELKQIKPQVTNHRHSRTKSRDLIPQGIAKARITSFEDKEKTQVDPASIPNSSELRRISSVSSTTHSRKLDLSPPIVFSSQSASQRDWAVPSIRRNMVRPRVSSIRVDEVEDVDLEISNDELLATHSSSQTRPQSCSPQPSLRDHTMSHERSKSMSPTLTVASWNKPPSSTRLVPANTHSTAYPSAFRVVPVDSDDARPGSSGSDSTISSAGPRTPSPSSPSASSSSWLDWSLSFLGSPKRPLSPVSKEPPISPVPSQMFAAQLTYTKNKDERNTPIVTRGIRDHWADIVMGPGSENIHRGKRTVSRQVKWEDEQSVRFSWF